MDINERLPIKVVMPRKQDIVKNNNNGGSKTFFCEVTPELRENIAAQFESLLKYYKHKFDTNPNIPQVGKIKMKKEAIAKSHKPNRLCAKNCQIIGTNTLDEILIKITKDGINNVIEEVKSSNTKELQANLTAIDSINPYTKKDIFNYESYEFIEESIDTNGSEILKVKLFDFNDEFENKKIIENFRKKIKSLGLIKCLKEIKYSEKQVIYRLEIKDKKKLKKIVNISGIKNIEILPRYNALDMIKSSYIESSYINKALETIKNNDYYFEHTNIPIIGIIDSGIKENHPFLEKWIYSKEEFIPKKYQNNEHGTFVAGVIQYGNELNGFKQKNPKRYKFLDVVALPNNNPKYGPVDYIMEDDLINIINTVIKKYSKEVKIWNISLNIQNKICNDNKLSDLAIFLDEISDKYNVLFIISSGNYDTYPYRRWPIVQNLKDLDRITSPAESVRSVTVGSIAHKETKSSLVKVNEPSPFSRKGPGANYIVKPDVVDYGGNISLSQGIKNLGIISFDENGKLISGVGTSYSTPRVTKKIAEIYDNLLDKSNLLLTKALLIHSTNFSKLGPIRDRKLINYYGFGMPSDSIEDTIKCTKNKITLIFDQTIQKGTHLEILNFPYPKKLNRGGKWKGEIMMTLLYNPPLNENFGQEYCRTNVEVTFGTYKIKKEGKIDYTCQVPQEIKWDERFELQRVQNGFKWCPVKSYYRNFKKGIELNPWKLRVDFSNRNEETTTSQRFILILTIIDNQGEDIYSDVIDQLRQSGFIFDDLRISEQIRQQIR